VYFVEKCWPEFGLWELLGVFCGWQREVWVERLQGEGGGEDGRQEGVGDQGLLEAIEGKREERKTTRYRLL
jgi:hypothetical protein